MPPKKLGMGEEDKLRPHLGSQVALEELWDQIRSPGCPYPSTPGGVVIVHPDRQ